MVQRGEVEDAISQVHDNEREKGSLVPHRARPSRYRRQVGIWVVLELLNDPVAFYDGIAPSMRTYWIPAFSSNTSRRSSVGFKYIPATAIGSVFSRTCGAENRIFFFETPVRLAPRSVSSHRAEVSQYQTVGF